MGIDESRDIIETFIQDNIKKLTETYDNDNIQKKMNEWYTGVTSGYKYKVTPHVNGFYFVFMSHGTWYDEYLKYMKTGDPKYTLSPVLNEGKNVDKNFFRLATDIDIPDINKEYISVSSRLRNSFSPSRDYFVSDFNISYIEDRDLTITRYHEAWDKYISLLKLGRIQSNVENINANSSYFIDTPYTNAVWVVLLKPFSAEIQMLIKLIGVVPVNFSLKNIIGNRSSSKISTLTQTYKASNIFYKIYNEGNDAIYSINNANIINGEHFTINNSDMLAKAFSQEIISKTYK